MFQGFIIEGISGSGKTTVMDHLLRDPAVSDLPPRSRLILTEHHTQRVLEGKEKQQTLKPADHICLLDDLVRFIETLQSRTQARGWYSSKLAAQGLFFLLERFHLTHVFRFPHMSWKEVTSIDQRMADVGARLCLLTVNGETLSQRLFAHSHPCWNQYLSRYGGSTIEIVESFLKMQAQAIACAEKTAMPLVQIDTSDLTPERVAEEIVTQTHLPGK